MEAPTSPRTDLRPEAAEALGVFFLVFVGCGAIIANMQSGALGHVGVSFVFAFVILVLVYALGHVCGAHFNPAITIAFAATGHFPWRRVPSYVAAQLAGAVAAALLLQRLHGPIADLGATTLAPDTTVMQAVAWEFLATFLLAFVIVAVATDRRVPPAATGIAIGLAVGIGALVAGPITGGSMNPARSIGPAIASGRFDGLWIYVAAPIAGALAAMQTYGFLRGASTPRADPATAAVREPRPQQETKP